MSVADWRMKRSECFCEPSYQLADACHSTYEGSMIQVSEQGLRKVLYQKVWPLIFSSEYLHGLYTRL
jgi:hypothetical protein